MNTIPKDNIKDFAVAAYRYYGHIKELGISAKNGLIIALAVSSALKHLKIERADIAAECVRRVYCSLPLGIIKRGVMSDSVIRASIDMCVSESVIWRELRRARYVFNYYYKEFIKT